MTDPKENEEISEELSTDELKSVSGGVNLVSRNDPTVNPSQNNRNSLNLSGNNNNRSYQWGDKGTSASGRLRNVTKQRLDLDDLKDTLTNSP